MIFDVGEPLQYSEDVEASFTQEQIRELKSKLWRMINDPSVDIQLVIDNWFDRIRQLEVDREMIVMGGEAIATCILQTYREMNDQIPDFYAHKLSDLRNAVMMEALQYIWRKYYERMQ